MLIAAIATLVPVIGLGFWLSHFHLLREEPPGRITLTSALHGILGTACLALVVLALRSPIHAPGAAGFGWISVTALALAFLGGLAILLTYLRGKGPPMGLVALHAGAGITGAVILAAWWAATAPSGMH